MYKSSPFTYFSSYVFPLLIVCISVLTIYSNWAKGSDYSIAYAKSMCVTTTWLLPFVVQIPFRLKYMEALDTKILVQNLFKTIEIDYRDILWITKYDLTSPFYVTIKYHDRVTGADKKIAFMPKRTDRRFFADDAMTTYIKNAMKTANTGPTDIESPSQLKNFLLLILMSLPFAVLNIYFMPK